MDSLIQFSGSLEGTQTFLQIKKKPSKSQQELAKKTLTNIQAIKHKRKSNKQRKKKLNRKRKNKKNNNKNRKNLPKKQHNKLNNQKLRKLKRKKRRHTKYRGRLKQKITPLLQLEMVEELISIYGRKLYK